MQYSLINHTDWFGDMAPDTLAQWSLQKFQWKTSTLPRRRKDTYETSFDFFFLALCVITANNDLMTGHPVLEHNQIEKGVVVHIKAGNNYIHVIVLDTIERTVS